jgi:hypothetical protein
MRFEGPGPISHPSGRSAAPAAARGAARRARRSLAVALVAALTAGGVAFAARAKASVPRGDPAARLPEGPLAGEYWDLVARFESGHVLMVTIALTNTGIGGRTAVAVGQLVEPDGTRHPFSRSERPGGWQLSDGGRRLDLQSIVLDQTGATRRFEVDKNELGIDVAIASLGAPAWPAQDAAPGCGLDVLEVAGPATGSFRSGERPAVHLRGLAALTHRWMPGLEADCLRRGVELFAMQDGVGVYFREAETPAGARRAWLVVQRDGRLLFEGPPAESEVTWRPGVPGYPEPARLRFAAHGVAGEVEFGASLGTFEPLARLPAPLRVAMELRTRPRLAWSAPRFELRLGGKPVLRGEALAKLAWTNPHTGTAPAEPLPADADPARGGE